MTYPFNNHWPFSFVTMLPLLFLLGITCRVAAQTISANESTPNSNFTGCRQPPRWFTQPIDHFGGNNNIFKQKYYISTDYYKPGGPILLFQGEESTDLDCIDSTIMYKFAQELHGIAVVLEHRYFGESVPFSKDLSTYTAEQWKYLTLDNVMEDAVKFVTSVSSNTTGSKATPVFAASGSYGAFLMTMFRQNRPKTFTGVIASAPALRGFYGGNETSVASEFSWWNYAGRPGMNRLDAEALTIIQISMTYREQSSEAAAKIQDAFDALAERFAHSGSMSHPLSRLSLLTTRDDDITTLQSELGLCQPVTDNSNLTLTNLARFLRQVYAPALEFNYNIARPGRSPIAQPLQLFIDIALDEQDPIQIINRTNWAWYLQSAATINKQLNCLDPSSASMQKLIAPKIQTTPFSYIACTYLSFALLTNDDTMFLTDGPPSLTYAAVSKICKEKYGVSAPTSKELYERYHFTDSELQNSTGIIFSLAQLDPTTGVSGLYDFTMPVTGYRYASRRIITTGMAHREDLFAQDADTKEAVRETNAIEQQIIKDWMDVVAESAA